MYCSGYDFTDCRPHSCPMQWYEKFTEADDIIPVSAKYGHGVHDVKDWILSKLPVGPAYYPKVYIINSYLPCDESVDSVDSLMKGHP